MMRISNFSSLTKHRLKKFDISEIEAILDIIPEATLLIDGRDGQIAGANAAATELSAYTRTELTQMGFEEIITDADCQNLLSEIRKSIGRMTYWELTMVKRGGAKISVRASPMSLDHDSEKIVIKFEPLSSLEQQRTERERQHQVWNGLHTLATALLEKGIDEALKLALEAEFILTGSSSVAIYQADVESPGLKKTYELGTKDILPESAGPYDLAALQKPTLWTPGKRTGTDMHRHARMANVSYVATAPIGQNNASVGLIAAASHTSAPPAEILEILKFMGVLITSIIQEQTLLTHLQNTIKDHNSALKKHTLITSSIQDGIVILKPDLTISEMNTLSEESLGYNSNEVQGQTIDKILISSDDLKPLLEKAKNEFSSSKLDGTRLYRRNGQAFVASLQTLPIIDADELAGVIIIIRDLSEQEEYRTLNQQLEQRALLGEVTASFAHEVRNPINNISTGLQVLALNLPADDANQDYVKRLKGDCDRLADLIKSSLTIVRPMEFNLKLVDIVSLLKFILDRHQARLVKANIQYNLQVEPNIPPINGDFSALDHAFQNLIENAIQAMGKEGGTLSTKIRLFQKTGELDYVEVNISDTGPGIEKARLLEETEQYARQLTILNDLTRKLTSTLEIEELYATILQNSIDMVKCDEARLIILNDRNQELVYQAVIGNNSDKLLSSRVSLDYGLIGKSFLSKTPILLNYYDTENKFHEELNFFYETSINSLMIIPMILKNQVLGLIELVNHQNGITFKNNDLELISALAAQAAIALENARLYRRTDQELAKRVEELSVMQRIDRDLNTSLDMKKAMEITLTWAFRQSGFDVGFIGLITESKIQIMASSGFNKDQLTKIENHSPFSGFLRTDSDSNTYQPIQTMANKTTQVHPKAILQILLPIHRDEKIIAMILLESFDNRFLDENEMNFLVRLCDHASIAIVNSQLYAEVQEANQAKSEFVSLVAHELKNPMTSIKGYTELLASGAVGSITPAQANFLSTIRNNTDRMNTLVSDLNDLTKIESGNMRMEPQALDLKELINELVRATRRQLEEKQQTLHVLVDEELPDVWADPNRLLQILTNLVSNAHKYTQINGEISVIVEKSKDSWGTDPSIWVTHIMVKDNGLGISVEDQKLIFQKFFRSEDADIRASSGTGLGLNITRSLVEMQGGRIWFESEFKKGTTFHFTLPLAK